MKEQVDILKYDVISSGRLIHLVCFCYYCRLDIVLSVEAVKYRTKLK